jgi:TolB-like protein/Flp pilus assembly protein TadD
VKIDSFFAELKRRNVYKVAAAYAVVAWLLVQAASILLPTFEAPPWTMKVLVLVLVLGFPVALIFSWAFEITPEGIKRESEMESGKSITHHTGRKIVAITIVLAVIAAGLLAFQLLRPKTTTKPTSTSTSAVPEKSVAVLPFESLSEDRANAYFADGIQDEILTRLSKIAALKVISRTSTQKYKSAPENLREVGKELGVTNLLEGSVQKIGDAVHITVQLIRATTDEHIWAESYNRKLDDVFAVEAEVATAIAEQLNAKLTGTEQKAVTDKPTQNVAAYDAYLRGLSVEHKQFSEGSWLQAVIAYEEAVRLDPKFALAWARLAVIRSLLYLNSIEPGTNTGTAVREAADRAMALAPEAGESWVAEGSYRYRVLRDFESALPAYQEAQKRLPNSSLVYAELATVQWRLGRWQKAEVTVKKALELDPQNLQILRFMGGFYEFLRRFDDALAVLNRALEVSPDSESIRAIKANVLLSAGRVSETARDVARIPADSTDVFVISIRLRQALYQRQYDAGINIVERKLSALPAGQPLEPWVTGALISAGYSYAWSGRSEDARRAFTRAIHEIQPTPDSVVPVDGQGTPTLPGLAYAGLGEKEKALEQARRAVKDYETDAVLKPQAEIALAQVEAQVGDHDAAIAALPNLLEVPAGLTTADLKFNPMWDPLRSDPRFQKFCEEKPR